METHDRTQVKKLVCPLLHCLHLPGVCSQHKRERSPQQQSSYSNNTNSTQGAKSILLHLFILQQNLKKKKSLDEIFRNMSNFIFVFPAFLAQCESIQHSQTLATGYLSLCKQNVAIRLCISHVFIQSNDIGIECNKKLLLKHTLKHDLG